MAEIVGIVSSTVQLLDYSIKLIIRVREFVSVDDATSSNNVFYALSTRLDLLKHILTRITEIQSHGTECSLDLHPLRDVIQLCHAHMKLLDREIKKAVPNPDTTPIRKIYKAICSLTREEKAQKVVKCLQDDLQLLQLSLQVVQLDQSLYVQRQISQANEASFPQPSKEEIVQLNPIQTRRARRQRSRLEGCLDGKCFCSCHKVSSYSGRFWSIRTPSLGWGFLRCDKQTCANKNIRFSARVSLSRFNALWALEMSLSLMYGPTAFSISPGLRAERVVKYTSPGFTVLWKCETGQITWPEAQQQLNSLFAEGQASIDDVDPSGASWLEKLLKRPWSYFSSQNFSSQDDHKPQYDALQFLVNRGAKLYNAQPLLGVLIGWFFKNTRLMTLQKLLECGYDVSNVDLQAVWDLERRIHPIHGSDHRTEDPFLLSFVKKCVESYSEFGDSSPFLEAATLGAIDDMAKLMPTATLQDCNCLGHSALHLVVSRPEMLRALVPRFGNVDLRDRLERTPLMYAAHGGHTESALILLNSNADPLAKDRGKWTFIEYGNTNCQWNLLIKSLDLIQSQAGSDTFKQLLYVAMKAYVSHLDGRRSLWYFQALLSFGVDINLVMWHRCTILHMLSDLDEIEALFRAGFDGVNSADNDGITALMAKVRNPGSAAIVRFCLDHGGDVTRQDNRGRTALHHALMKLACGNIPFSPTLDQKSAHEATSIVKLLLDRGADPTAHDNCICACSHSGCTPSTTLLGSRPFGYFWSIEYLSTLIYLGMEEQARMTLLDFIRVEEFEERGLTHVCCSRGGITTRNHSICEIIETEDPDSRDILEIEDTDIRDLDSTLAAYSDSDFDTLQDMWIDKLVSCSIQDSDPVETKWDVRLKAIGPSWADLGPPSAGHTIDPIRDKLLVYYVEPESNEEDSTSALIRWYRDWLDNAPRNCIDLEGSAPPGRPWHQTRLDLVRRLQQALKSRANRPDLKAFAEASLSH